MFSTNRIIGFYVTSSMSQQCRIEGLIAESSDVAGMYTESALTSNASQVQCNLGTRQSKPNVENKSVHFVRRHFVCCIFVKIEFLQLRCKYCFFSFFNFFCDCFNCYCSRCSFCVCVGLVAWFKQMMNRPTARGAPPGERITTHDTMRSQNNGKILLYFAVTLQWPSDTIFFHLVRS